MLRIAFALLVVALASGCGGRVDALRARYARDTDCEASGVDISSVDATHYLARGCDRTVTYVCDSAVGTSADRCSEARDQPATAELTPTRTSIPGTDPNLPTP